MAERPDSDHELERAVGLEGYGRAIADEESGTQIPRTDSLTSANEHAGRQVHSEPELTEAMYASFKLRYLSELEDLRADEFRRAHEEGHSAGQAEGIAQYTDGIQRLELLVENAASSVNNTLDAMTDSVVDIVLEATTRVFGHALADKAGTEAVVREVIRQCKDRTKLVIRVSPKDVEMLVSACTKLTEGLNASHVEIVGDDLVENGGCVLETPSGTLDGRLDIQLQYLRDALEAARTKWHGASA